MERRIILAIVFSFILFVMPTDLSAYTPDGYIGCYHRKSLVMLYQKSFSRNKGDKCMNLCLHKSFRYAATEHSVCFCGNKLREEHSVAMKCYEECPGNKNEICGGLYSEISLYDISQTTLTLPRTTTTPTTTKTTTTTTTATTETTTATTKSLPTTLVRTEGKKVTGTHSTEIAATNSSKAVTNADFQRLDDKYKYHIVMYVSIPATVAIVGTVVVIIVVCKVTRRKQKPVHYANTSRKEMTTEDKLPKDDDSEHIYDQCACPQEVAYYSNGEYLTPVVGTMKRLQEDATPLNKRKEKTHAGTSKGVNNATYGRTDRTENTYEELIKDDSADKNVYQTACYE
ncbi:uncharacterized protein LOC123551719 [Mercenaria mercenaria]|uniref:uncharacterized protein LOC123551719 n=1 Tax=Mercenaria mercenaria TaxID=6596 RepID=UPI00234E4053|nr:uncharacterized protein LOC123551719 [Mercenaria mercenaria]